MASLDPRERAGNVKPLGFFVKYSQGIMFSDFSEIILSAIAGLLFILLMSTIFDLYFMITGNKVYYTNGVLMFVKRVSVNHHYSITPQQIILEKKFHSRTTSSFIFTEINSFSYGFHQEIIPFPRWRSIPNVMHGSIIFDTKNNQVVVKGFANYSTLAIYFAWLIMTALKIFQDKSLAIYTPPLVPVMTIMILVFLFWLMYLIQSARLEEIATFAAQSWERKHMNEAKQSVQQDTT